MRATTRLVLTACVCLTIAVRHVHAQFTTIINLPPDLLPEQIESNTQINILPGGEVPDGFEFPMASPDVMNVELNLDGGLIGKFVRAAGAVVNVQAGRIDWGFQAVDGTTVNVSGGAIGPYMRLSTGSVLNVTGGAVQSSLEALQNTTINMSGGRIDTSEIWEGSVLNMTGGVITTRISALQGSTINISGGEISGGETPAVLSLSHDTVLNLSGGRHANICSYGIVNVTGDVQVESLDLVESFGNAGELFMSSGYLHWDSAFPSPHRRVDIRGAAQITGGRIGANMDLWFVQDAKGLISGGALGGRLITAHQSDVKIQGTNLRLDGELVSGGLEPGERVGLDFDQLTVVSGTLADGSPFIYSMHNEDRLSGENVHFELVDRTSDRASLIELPRDPVPLGAATGETVVVGPRGDVYSGFQAGWDSTLIVAGGTVGDRLRASGSRVVVESGSIGDTFHAYHGTTVELYGGAIGDDFSAFEDSTVIVRGGAVGDGFRVHPLATVHWYGGDLGDNFVVEQDANLQVYGSEFYLGDQLLDLPLGESRQLTDATTLTATLADGSQPTIRVGGVDENLGSALSVLVTRVSAIPGDYNNNGLVEQSDLDLVLGKWGTSPSVRLENWMNDLPRGVVDQGELDRVLSNWGRSLPTGISANLVPEPATVRLMCCAVAAAAALALRRRFPCPSNKLQRSTGRRPASPRAAGSQISGDRQVRNRPIPLRCRIEAHCPAASTGAMPAPGRSNV